MDMQDEKPLSYEDSTAPPPPLPPQRQVQQNLAALFQQAAEDVRVRASRVEESVFRPAGIWASGLARQRPMLAMFLGVFAVLSALPILSFIGFALLATVFIAGTCLSVAALCLGLVLCFAGGLLLFALLFTLATSLFLTASLLSLFVAYRLSFHVRTSGVGPGLGGWVDETRGRFSREARGAARKADVKTNGTAVVTPSEEVQLDGVQRRLQ